MIKTSHPIFLGYCSCVWNVYLLFLAASFFMHSMSYVASVLQWNVAQFCRFRLSFKRTCWNQIANLISYNYTSKWDNKVSKWSWHFIITNKNTSLWYSLEKKITLWSWRKVEKMKKAFPDFWLIANVPSELYTSIQLETFNSRCVIDARQYKYKNMVKSI